MTGFYDKEQHEDPSHLLGYLNCNLKFIHDHIPNEDKDMITYKKEIKVKLFEILEKEMLKARKESTGKEKKNELPKIYSTLEHIVSFRRNVSLDESLELNKGKEELWLVTAESSELMNKFYANLDLTHQEFRGDLKFSIVARDGDLENLQVTLKSANRLVPRQGKSSLDFSISLAFLQTKSDNYKTKSASKIHVKRTECIFDLIEDIKDNDNQSETYNNGSQGSNEYSSPNLKINSKSGRFLEFVLYDHSSTRTVKYFRGYALFCLEDFDFTTETLHSVKFSKFPQIDGESKNRPIFNELKKRSVLKPTSKEAKFIKDIEIFRDEKWKSDLNREVEKSL